MNLFRSSKLPAFVRPGRLLAALACILGPTCLTAADAAYRTLSREVLRDKIRGAWAGQMLGVVYGAPTEFKALGHIIEGEIKPFPISNALVQDDLYVEMTFAQVMDTVGLDATSDDYGAAFKHTQYDLWHGNAGARRNLNRGIPGSLSGHPRYNIHANDIDFQIVADFIGIMCPGLPQASNHHADRVGRVIGYGDGLYGGMFVAGMYAAAFVESDLRKVVAAGLACIPADSGYARLISDLLIWSAEEPDWRKTWQKLEDKWNKDDACPDGALVPFNIDAGINGGYIVLGLLYGRGDWQQTMEISTRAGQDSDCNPSSALGVLGAIIGYDRIPAHLKPDLEKIADQKFSYTDYSLNDIVRSSETRALKVIKLNGGRVTDTEVVIPRQEPRPPKLALSNFGVPTQILGVQDAAWTWQGDWTKKGAVRESEGAGSEVTLKFNGTGVALVGNLSQSGGRADVWLNGVKSDLVADAYIVPRTHDNDLWRIHGLPLGEHTLRLVMRDDADPRSKGRKLPIHRAVVYRTR